MNKVRMILVVAVLAVTLPLYSAEMKTTPQTPNWVADGVTEYVLFVWVDNTGLGGEPTDGAQWKLFSPNTIFTYVDGSSAKPSEDDFFSDAPMFFEIYQPPTGVSARVIQEIAGGPVDHQGNVGEFRFTVAANAPPGLYTFPLSTDGSLLVSPDFTEQPYTASVDLISVVPSQSIFINCLSGPSVIAASGCEPYDFYLTPGFHIDLREFQLIQNMYVGN